MPPTSWHGLTVLIRLATGQGVVFGDDRAGIISAADPATGELVGVNPALLVLATAAVSDTLTTLTMHLLVVQN
ncbi:hypothetical protein ACLK19_29155 [Escherichia coli]